ncbi:MAG: ABC transporter ATP-binding protein [Spirochaetaceae bacterium]
MNDSREIKETESKGGLSLLRRFVEEDRLLYAGAILSVAIATLASYLVPIILSVTIDSVIGGEPVKLPGPLESWVARAIADAGVRERLWVPALLALLVTLAGGVFQYQQKKLSAEASEGTAERMRNALYDHLQHLSYDYHVKAETGDLIQRCTSDVETVRRFLSIQLVELARAIILAVTAYPLLFAVHPPLALLSLPIVALVLLYSIRFRKRVEAAFSESDEAEGRLSTVLQENLTGVRVVRAFGRQRFEEEKFAERNREFRDLTRTVVDVLARYWATNDLLAMLHMTVTLLAGTWFAVNGVLSIGDLVVFLSVERMLLWPVRELGRILADMGRATVSIGRIGEVLETPTEYGAEPGLRPRIRGHIEFKEVRFGYEGEREILKGVSFTAEPGMTVAILGPTGSGKSSLVQLLARLYDYTGGSITVDGVELKEIDKKWIRSHIGFVLQEPFLFAKTVKENIRLAHGAARDAELFEAAREAAIHDVILGFEKGYDTLVGERGVTLSGGQKQRVAIARALITSNPILIFDDSLSAVDTETDAAIRRALLQRRRGATTFLISHRATTLAAADLILVIDEGRIVQAGNHAELIRQEGLYRRVWEIQNSLEEELTHGSV